MYKSKNDAVQGKRACATNTKNCSLLTESLINGEKLSLKILSKQNQDIPQNAEFKTEHQEWKNENPYFPEMFQ